MIPERKTDIQPITSVVDPRELPMLLELRGVSLSDSILRVTRAVQIQDRATVVLGQMQIRELAHLVDQALEQILERWEPGQVQTWPATLLVREGDLLEVWLQPDAASPPYRIGALREDQAGEWRSAEEVAWRVSSPEPEEAARQMVEGLSRRCLDNVRRIGSAA